MTPLAVHREAKRQHRTTAQRLIQCPGLNRTGCDSIIDADAIALCSNCRRDQAAQPSVDAPAEDSANVGRFLIGARQAANPAGEAGGVSLVSSAANFNERTHQ